MNLTCPQCSQQLPHVERLTYRFCPHCGAEIAAEPEKLDNAYLTIPPDLPASQADQQPMDLGPQAAIKSDAQPFDDQTIQPHTIAPPGRPDIRAPDEPPPSSFFRKPPELPDPPPMAAKEKPPIKIHRKVIIAVLVLLAVIILIIGGLFTF